MQLCRLIGAKLIIAKLDRLSRDVHFLTGLEKAGIEFVCADMPEANRLTIHIMAVMAQHEREAISSRTKAALAAAKRRGVKLGGDRGVRFSPRHIKLAVAARREKARARAADLAPIVQELRAAGIVTLQAIADGLNERAIPAARGGQWGITQVVRLLETIENPFAAAAA